jgi:hypothetical protein
LAEEFGQLAFKDGGEAEGDAVVKLASNRFVNIRITAAKNHRPQSTNQINITIPVNVKDITTITMTSSQRATPLRKL